MPYVPKNRIQTNLYTPGNEFYIEGVSFNYVGYFHKLYTGKTYTGKNPNDKPVYPLTPIAEYNLDDPTLRSKISVLETFENTSYTELKQTNSSIEKFSPQLFYTQPTEDNYKLGEFQRFFCKKRNEFIYLEISKSEFDKLAKRNPTIDFTNWNPFSIPWQLTGDKTKTYDINRNIVLLKEKTNKFYGFRKYLQKDYLRYYKP